MRSWTARVALAGTITLGLVAPAGAHSPGVQGTTTVDPTSGSRGSHVTAGAQGVDTATGSPYSLMFADSNFVRRFDQSQPGHSSACAHGTPVAEPVSPEADGSIPAVDATIPFWASSGTAQLCFTNGSHVTEPAAFNVT